VVEGISGDAVERAGHRVWPDLQQHHLFAVSDPAAEEHARTACGSA
jgi:hypothetical protein